VDRTVSTQAISDHPDWLPGECTDVLFEGGKWYVLYGKDNCYKNEVPAEPPWRQCDMKVRELLGENRAAWRAYRELYELRKMDSGERLEREIIALLRRQDNSEICEILIECASARYELEAQSTARAGAVGGSCCNMMNLWATIRDEAIKRSRAINGE